jgi:hypothetical protein
MRIEARMMHGLGQVPVPGHFTGPGLMNVRPCRKIRLWQCAGRIGVRGVDTATDEAFCAQFSAMRKVNGYGGLVGIRGFVGGFSVDGVQIGFQLRHGYLGLAVGCCLLGVCTGWLRTGARR